ncbi:ATP-binding protein [Aurantimonas sp. VKM B-3413]|uniref:ATP-binding protein n=1 Tax=Aurantimonas sp. VKM B-3413 TaxID=2779401 RepID=UPI001E58BB2A|nr:ATP-binding protein [Aurantimonas sp. VKM B-3413]MCB8836738.1 HAMP domain-containing protein [Aurantimonas sp. VKM B-3413]
MRHDLTLPRRASLPATGTGGSDASILRLSIAHRVFLVGAVPIALAVVIGIASIILLDRADEARRGALTVATVFRHVVAAMAERDAFIAADPSERDRHQSAFAASTAGANAGLKEIADGIEDPMYAEAVSATITALDRFRLAMDELKSAIGRNDERLAATEAQLASLIALTDEARIRQHAANVDVVDTLRARDAKLREAQNLTAAAQRMRTAVVDAWTKRLQSGGRSLGEEDATERARLANAAAALSDTLDAARLFDETTPLRALVDGVVAGGSPDAALAWIDRRLKIDGTAARSLQEEVAELLTYTVEAHETEQATQNIAVETLKLSQRTSDAMRRRNIDAISAVLEESRQLADKIASLPISPLIQTEMLDALDLWRGDLTDVRGGLATQNDLLQRMSQTSGEMVFEVSNLNTALSANADVTGTAARRILMLSAGFGLVAAAFFGFVVAHSITRPLKRLEHDMLERAINPAAGPLPDRGRRDEVGQMARATNHFLDELGKRESALMAAKEDTDRALAQLKRAQRELIQSEKLASLGQLVAGVAHEINTPLGVALTTATVLREETAAFQSAAGAGKVTRQAFDDFIARTGEGARLIAANLDRAAHLVVSFKQVAADQASGERRAFLMDAFADELFTSLGPMGRRAGHKVTVVCEPGIEMQSYPGALSQVLTNLLTNAYVHGFDGIEGGKVRIEIARHGEDLVRIVFSDDGRGILSRNRERIFDPFFTTRRASGSTGLGLHIVYNLVTATLGGTIGCASEPGEGTRFTIDIPRQRSQAPAAGEAIAQS